MSVCAWCGESAVCTVCGGVGKLTHWDEPRQCHTCGGSGVRQRLVQRPIVRTIKGVKTTVALAKYAPVCAEHAKIPEAPEPTSVRAAYAARAKGWKNRQEKLI